ncbi:hypothetical protein HQ312_12420 [Rhodococcus sp. BP-316]|nr:hypothetical protein [Rhodococcus sp. BP-316]
MSEGSAAETLPGAASARGTAMAAIIATRLGIRTVCSLLSGGVRLVWLFDVGAGGGGVVDGATEECLAGADAVAGGSFRALRVRQRGQMARFQNGVIYWSPATGAWPVTGRILDQWAGVGYETGPLRYPTAEQVDNGVTIEQSFQGGKLETPGANAVELATQNPGTTAQEMIDEAIFNAQQRALDVADVILEAVEGGRIETLASDPVTGSPTTLPFARGAGDIFYADADTANVNHGHNGIFISTTETVEALNPTKGVQLTDNTTGNPDGTRRTVYGPKMMFVNTSSGVRANAVFFALNQVGKDYNSNFAFNKRFINGDAYNCSSLVWAAFQSASGGGVDLDQEPGGGEDATPSGIFPNEIVKSDWTTLYP